MVPVAHADLRNPAVLAGSVRAAQAGDLQATENLAKRFLRPAYLVALSIVTRPSDAEDVAQDSLILALSRIETCRAPEAFPGWLMQIVRNQARNLLARRRVRDVSALEPAEPPDTSSPPSSRQFLNRERLLTALKHLTETERAIVLLHDLEGYAHAEIAEALELSIVNSRQQLFVARKKLRERLDPPEPTP